MYTKHLIEANMYNTIRITDKSSSRSGNAALCVLIGVGLGCASTKRDLVYTAVATNTAGQLTTASMVRVVQARTMSLNS